jgi:hypothetical protein
MSKAAVRAAAVERREALVQHLWEARRAVV